MNQYIINTNKTNGTFGEIHKITCLHLSTIWNQEDLGCFSDDYSSIAYANRNGYLYADGCAYCCKVIFHR